VIDSRLAAVFALAVFALAALGPFMALGVALAHWLGRRWPL
jgi:hypothetical protein